MQKKKKVRYSKFIVFLVIVLNATFAYKTLNVFEVTGNEPTALIAAWFAFTTGELWILSGIKKYKTKLEVKEDEN